MVPRNAVAVLLLQMLLLPLLPRARLP